MMRQMTVLVPDRVAWCARFLASMRVRRSARRSAMVRSTATSRWSRSGAGFGPLVLSRLGNDVRRPGWLFGPYLLRGVIDLVLAASSSFAVALGALGVYGVGTSTGNVTYNSVLQTVVPDRLRGRVFAFYDVVWQSGRLASIAAGGVVADAIGIRAVYVFGGALLLAAGLIGITSFGRDTHRELPRP